MAFALQFPPIKSVGPAFVVQKCVAIAWSGSDILSFRAGDLQLQSVCTAQRQNATPGHPPSGSPSSSDLLHKNETLLRETCVGYMSFGVPIPVGLGWEFEGTLTIIAKSSPPLMYSFWRPRSWLFASGKPAGLDVRTAH